MIDINSFMINRQSWKHAVFMGLLILLCLAPVNARAEDRDPGPGRAGTGDVQKRQEQVRLWNRAMAFLGDGNKQEAAPLFKRYYDRYPESEKAEEALWHAATMHKHLALVSEDADWDTIKDLYREFTVAFPESELLPRAYLEVGRSYMEMGYFREAVPYFGIIVRRFPERQEIAEEASILKSRALYKTGRVEEAVNIYRELGGTVNENYGRLADGYQYYRQERYHDALGSFLKILKREPSFYLKEPDLLRIMGRCYLQTGQTEQGRRRLEHYLNLNSGSHREEVLFRIGESYLEEGKESLAARLYEKAMAASNEGERIYSFSRYRLARIEEERERAKPGGREIPREKFVQVREAVLEHGNTGEVIQQARLELIEHYRDRQEIDEVYDLGRIYLNYDSKESGRKKVERLVCGILDERLGQFLEQEKYADIYQVYKDEFTYIKRCDKASVRIKVGRALEKMALYDKASTVYWRAMKLEISPEEKRDLYMHRAETYMAGKAYESAATLLSHLRRIYEGKPIIGDVYFLSGILREAQGKEGEALEFYEKAASEPFFYEEKRSEFAEKYLSLLLKRDRTDDFAEKLERFRIENWLDLKRLQYWYVRLGDHHRKNDEPAKAGSAYGAALADGMPTGNEIIQKAFLYYGDVQLSLGNVDKAADLHGKALNGPNQLFTKIARQRLKEDEMTRSLPETE